MTESLRVLVVIPTYNERDNLPRIVPRVLEQGDAFHVLVVDDNSPDGTGDVADELAAGDERVAVLHRPGKQGLGAAYVAGFTWGLKRDFDVFVEMDADLSHPPAILPVMLDEIRRGVDVVVGSRYVDGRITVVNWPVDQPLRVVVRTGHHPPSGPRRHRRLQRLPAPCPRARAAGPDSVERIQLSDRVEAEGLARGIRVARGAHRLHGTGQRRIQDVQEHHLGGRLAGLEVANPGSAGTTLASWQPMALVDLCYRCPQCGHDPVGGDGDAVWCESCGIRIERSRGRLLLSLAERDQPFDVSATDLCRRIDEHGGPITRATREDGTLEYSARARISWRVAERAVRYRGVLRGFVESMGPPAPGTVTVDRDRVHVDAGGRDAGSWRHLDLGAVQASSSSLQLSLPDDQLVQFRFEDDSPRRWETLMRRLISDAYERAGRGRVVEFQPRIVTRW